MGGLSGSIRVPVTHFELRCGSVVRLEDGVILPPLLRCNQDSNPPLVIDFRVNV